MKTNHPTLLGLSLWLILIGGAIIFGAYTGSLNDSNANTVIGALILAGDVIGLTFVWQCLYLARKHQPSGRRKVLNIYK